VASAGEVPGNRRPIPQGLGEQPEAQMSNYHPVKKMIALALGGAAVAVAAQTSTPAPGARADTRPVSAAAGNQGNPNAVPPILAPLRPAELAQMRRAEAQEQQRFAYRLPANARYSTAEMNVIAAEGYGPGAPPDSGLVACAYPLTTQDVPATAYEQIRAEFAGSRWPDLRAAGTAYVDLAIKLLSPQYTDGYETVSRYQRLAAACAKHGRAPAAGTSR
jgi:hypothetical protein